MNNDRPHDMIIGRFDSMEGAIHSLSEKVDRGLEMDAAQRVIVKENSTNIAYVQKEVDGLKSAETGRQKDRRNFFIAISLAIWSTVTAIGVAIFEVVKR